MRPTTRRTATRLKNNTIAQVSTSGLATSFIGTFGPISMPLSEVSQATITTSPPLIAETGN
jgi:hypothetical protein